MLDPARFWEVLGKFLLCHTAHFAPGVKEDAAVRRRTGVQRHNVLLVSHRNSPLSFIIMENRYLPLLYRMFIFYARGKCTKDLCRFLALATPKVKNPPSERLCYENRFLNNH